MGDKEWKLFLIVPARMQSHDERQYLTDASLQVRRQLRNIAKKNETWMLRVSRWLRIPNSVAALLITKESNARRYVCKICRFIDYGTPHAVMPQIFLLMQWRSPRRWHIKHELKTT